MRKLILAMIVVAGGFSVVQDAQARWWLWGSPQYRRVSVPYRSPQRADNYVSGRAVESERQYRPPQQYRLRKSRIYYDSGIAFEYKQSRPHVRSQGRYQGGRIYYDSGIAFEYKQTRPQGRYRQMRPQRRKTYYDSGIAFEY